MQPPAATTSDTLPITSSSNAATFAASWPAIQAALESNDLKQAHQLLSKWHGDESLAPADAQKVETLLGQLAGTVIYSNEHRLEPARVVKPGETLESIAKEYNVPWQLLAKINGIPAPDQVRPGQELKVVRGPFSAVVDLRRNELTLEIRRLLRWYVPRERAACRRSGRRTMACRAEADGGQPSATPSAYRHGQQRPFDRTPQFGNWRGAALRPHAYDCQRFDAAAASPGPVTLQVAPQDAEDLSDILSIGSRVIVRK